MMKRITAILLSLVLAGSVLVVSAAASVSTADVVAVFAGEDSQHRKTQLAFSDGTSLSATAYSEDFGTDVPMSQFNLGQWQGYGKTVQVTVPFGYALSGAEDMTVVTGKAETRYEDGGPYLWVSGGSVVILKEGFSLFYQGDAGGVGEIPSDWARQQVEEALGAGLVPEELQGDYTGAVSRGKVAEMFIRLLELCTGMDIDAFLSAQGVQIDQNAFADTTDKNVLAANALGIINGVGEGRFAPEGTFTRAQIAAILNRTAQVLGVQTSGYPHSFTDVAGHWVSGELGWPVHAEIIQGVAQGRFSPDGVLTTEQAIVITQRALEALG